MNLEGKTVLIVGAGRGIGRACAELFSNAEANVVLASRNEAELMELEYKLNAKGNSNVLSLAADATVERDVKSLVGETINRFGRIDTLVYSAGVGILKPFSELTAEEFDTLLSVNARGAFNVLQAVLPVMQEQKAGRVIALPGILGKAPMPQAAGYCAAKYALTGMIKCLAQEYKRFNINFSLMHFGGVDSNFWDNITMRVQRDKMLSVEAAAHAVFFAATQDASGVLGELILQPESHQLV